MKNKHCNYTSSHIMTTNIFMYNQNVCCHYISSYITINKYCYNTSSCIMRNTL